MICSFLLNGHISYKWSQSSPASHNIAWNYSLNKASGLSTNAKWLLRMLFFLFIKKVERPWPLMLSRKHTVATVHWDIELHVPACSSELPNFFLCACVCGMRDRFITETNKRFHSLFYFSLCLPQATNFLYISTMNFPFLSFMPQPTDFLNVYLQWIYFSLYRIFLIILF